MTQVLSNSLDFVCCRSTRGGGGGGEGEGVGEEGVGGEGVEINHHRHHGRAASQGHRSRRPRRPQGQGHPGPKYLKKLQNFKTYNFVNSCSAFGPLASRNNFLSFFSSEHLLRIMINILTYLM